MTIPTALEVGVRISLRMNSSTLGGVCSQGCCFNSLMLLPFQPFLYLVPSPDAQDQPLGKVVMLAYGFDGISLPAWVPDIAEQSVSSHA